MSVPAPLYRPGSWCDVAVWIDGRLLQVTADGPLVRCYLENALVWQQAAPEALLFCRGAVQGNKMLTVHQGHLDGSPAYLVGDGLVQSLGPNFGEKPVGIDGHEAYVVSTRGRLPATPGVYQRIGLVAQPYPFPANVPPDSSQGLSDVQPDGTLWWADQHRTMTIGGTVFTYPNVRSVRPGSGLNMVEVTVGQVDPPGIAAAVAFTGLDVKSRTVITRVIDGDAYEPHVAVSPNGRVAICARTAKGAAYVATTIQELSQ